MGNPPCGEFLVGKPKVPQRGIPLQCFRILFWTSMVLHNNSMFYFRTFSGKQKGENKRGKQRGRQILLVTAPYEFTKKDGLQPRATCALGVVSKGDEEFMTA
jgi:hypothetical protein